MRRKLTLIEKMKEKFLMDSDTERTFVEKYTLRMQVRMLEEENMMQEVVNVFH